MTILFVTHYAGFYGANKSLLTLMQLLRERHQVRPLVLLPSEGEMCARVREAGIDYKVEHYYWWVNYNHGVWQWLLNKRKQLINYLRVRHLCSLYKGENIDMVYSNSVCVNVGLLMAKRFGLPHIWQARESLSQFSLSLSLSLGMSKRLWADPVTKCHIMISDYMMHYYSRYMPQERMVRVYNGVSLPAGVKRKEPNMLLGRLQVACVGIVGEQKNQMELLRAQLLLHQQGVDIDTWILGSPTEPYFAHLLDYVEQNGLKEYVHLMGHTADVWKVLQRMNLGVVCARDEAFGRVTVEYMLMQMPVVVADSGANKELVEEGVTGEVYRLGDAEQLAQKIRQYAEMPKLLVSQGNAAEQKAKREFSAELNAEQIYKCIINLIHNS